LETIDLISGIAVIALYAALIALIIYLIVALKRIVGAIDNINGTVDKMEQKIDHLTTKAEPLIENSLLISNDIKEISGTIKTQAAKVEGIVDSVKATTDSIIEFEQNVQKEVETNVYDTLNMIAALSRGVRTFLSVLTGSRTTNGAHRKTRSDSDSKDSYIEQEEDYYN
jgi:uncharacterized protein YoxC